MSRGGPGASVIIQVMLIDSSYQHILEIASDHNFSCFLDCLFTLLMAFSFELLLLSRFSRVRLCATLQTAAHQLPPTLGFSEWAAMSFFFEQKPPILTVQLTCPRLRISSFCVLDKSPTSWRHSLRVETLRETQAIIRNYRLVALLFVFRFMILQI